MSPVATMIDDSRGGQTEYFSNNFGTNISQSQTVTMNNMNNMQEEQQQRVRQLQYSIPGILHFIQHEWARFEMERAQWDVERAELQAKIAFLQGERKGQENLKRDLIRRIKMLEYALKQERAKFHKLKYGTELVMPEEKLQESMQTEDGNQDDRDTFTANENISWRQGRHLLRQYLQEIGYTDTIINVRSQRVRALLGLQRGNSAGVAIETSGEQSVKRASETQGGRQQGKKSTSDNVVQEAENSVLATFDFLKNAYNEADEFDDGKDGDDMDDDDGFDTNLNGHRGGNNTSEDQLDDADTEEALAEFDFLGSDASEDGRGMSSEEWNVSENMMKKLKEQYKNERKAVARRSQQRLKRSTLQSMIRSLQQEEEDLDIMPDGVNAVGQRNITYDELEDSVLGSGSGCTLLANGDEDMGGGLSLGELKDISINNDSEPLSYDLSVCKEALRKTWVVKYTLRSHFDSVYTLAFHPRESILITGSEDHTLKLWNLSKTVPTKKAASLDVEPIYTFRGHTASVLTLVIDPSGDDCFSAGADGSIFMWHIPDADSDPYDTFSPDVQQGVIPDAHADAIWSLALHPTRGHLLSAGADGLVKLWDPHAESSKPLHTFQHEKRNAVPTSVDYVYSDLSHMVTSYNDGSVCLYDLETAKTNTHFDVNPETGSGDSNVSNTINQVVCHPTLPITITGHENRHIKFFDNNSGKLIHSMVAHLDSVTSLAVDPNGLYLLSGSHDSSIRLWNLDSKTCVQEITSHRKKFDDSIYSVAFHPSKPYIASGGADALAKVFV